MAETIRMEIKPTASYLTIHPAKCCTYCSSFSNNRPVFGVPPNFCTKNTAYTNICNYCTGFDWNIRDPRLANLNVFEQKG